MATFNLLILLDDIASVLDDVAVLTKVATKKTAAVLGDDLALNAEQLSNLQPSRELPVVWAVAKGSFLNKAILVPVAILLSALTPWLVGPLMIVGGAYLCYEGFEKVFHKLLHKREGQQRHKELVMAVCDPKVDLVEFEKSRIKAAVRTDFILSAEILVIALGTAAKASLLNRFLVLVAIAIVFTIVVYGLVAAIVKLDDLGIVLRKKTSSTARSLGGAILHTAPYLLRGLTVAGTVAMFLVGGGIITHGVPPLRALVEHFARGAGASSSLLASVVPAVSSAIVGIAAGGVLLLLVRLGMRLFKSRSPAPGDASGSD